MEADYCILTADTAPDLMARVNDRLAAGWVTAGGVTILPLTADASACVFAQAVVRTDRPQLEAALLSMANEAFMYLRRPAVVSVLHKVEEPPREPWQGEPGEGG